MIPADWAQRSPIHQQALAYCRQRAEHKPLDCSCCGCHTDQVDRAIDNAVLIDMVALEQCPAERRALLRILASR